MTLVECCPPRPHADTAVAPPFHRRSLPCVRQDGLVPSGRIGGQIGNSFVARLLPRIRHWDGLGEASAAFAVVWLLL